MFDCFKIDEPRLIFGNLKESVDPKFGLLNGPYHPEDSPIIPNQIKIGVISDAEFITKTKDLMKRIMNPISNSKKNRLLFPFFPGSRNIGVDIINRETWNRILTKKMIESILEIPNTLERIGKAANLFQNELEAISEKSIRPDVVICALPEKIDNCIGEATFATKNIHKTAKFTKLERKILQYEETGQKQLGDFFKTIEKIEIDKERYYNFRRVLKAKVMEINNPIPIQIIRPRTFHHGRGVQEESEIAWNLFVGLFYKAGGIPWKVTGLAENTCYIGISFYREKSSENLRTSLAQIFSETGEGFVLRGESFYWEDYGYPHLNEDAAKDLLSDAVKLYEKHTLIKPKRVVIHKTSYYDRDELEGFQKGLGKIPTFDFISFRGTGIRFLRSSKTYPILRGTVIRLPDNSIILYTNGFSPFLKTYRGHGIPRPLLISEHHGDSEADIICKEIFSLTKLNWNSADFNLGEPITTNFARRIGTILSEYTPSKKEQDQFRYYM